MDGTAHDPPAQRNSMECSIQYDRGRTHHGPEQSARPARVSPVRGRGSGDQSPSVVLSTYSNWMRVTMSSGSQPLWSQNMFTNSTPSIFGNPSRATSP